MRQGGCFACCNHQPNLGCAVVSTTQFSVADAGKARWRTRCTAFQGLGGMESNMAARRRTQGSGMKSPLDARICALFTYMPDRSSSISYTAAPSASCRTAHLASTSCNTRVAGRAWHAVVRFLDGFLRTKHTIAVPVFHALEALLPPTSC